MAEEKGRNVYGSDLIVTYTESSDEVSVKRIFSHQGNNGRFTPTALIESLGYTPETATKQFVKNNNLHDPGKCCRGAVVLINLRIGIIVKSVGSYILFHSVLPVRSNGFEIIDLRRKDRYFGFYLQQIRGQRMGKMSCRRHGPQTYEDGDELPYVIPYTIKGNVYMDPEGPDFCVSKSVGVPPQSPPPSILEQFSLLEDNLSTTVEEKTKKKHKYRRKCSKGNVLYVVDNDSRVGIPNKSDCFYLPYAWPVEEVMSPWKKDQV